MTTDTDRVELLIEEARRVSRPSKLPVRAEIPAYVSLDEAAIVLHVPAEEVIATLERGGVRVRRGETDEPYVDTGELFALHAREREEAWAEYMRLSELVGLDDVDPATLNTRLE